MKEKRDLKVNEAPGNVRNVPRILLQGAWLASIGYNVGDHITVTLSENQIIIKPADDK